MNRSFRNLGVAASVALLFTPGIASAHFLWLTVEPTASPRSEARIHAFLNETPDPGGPQFLKFVKDVAPSVDGQALPVATAEETVDSTWEGKLPAAIDAERNLGVKTKDGKAYRLYYTARAQTEAAAEDAKEGSDKLRVRVIKKGDRKLLQVLFDGKPVAKARIKIYPNGSDVDSKELAADDQGTASIDGLAEGKTAIWANWTEPKPGEVDGKPFAETRYYATLTFTPRDAAVAQASNESAAKAEATTTFATMPSPAVNSFGGAVLGDWLYVYSGHVGKTHEYSTETTSKKFLRLNLKDRKTWEELPMSKDVQGVALVSDGKYIYRNGGMSAKNKPDDEHDLYSVPDFARFDPETKTWTDLAPMPIARSTHDAVVVGRKVFAVGGWTMKGATEKAVYLENAVVFDLDRPEQGWKTIEQPFRRRALSAAEAGGKLYVIGGLSDKFKVERRVDVYDPATDKWALAPEIPGKGKNDGFGTSAFGVDGRVYYSGAAGHIYRLNDKGNAWELVGAWSHPRITHRILPGPDHTLLAVGGNSKGKQNPVIEAISLPTVEAPKKVASGN